MRFPWGNGWIDDDEMFALGQRLSKTGYGQYLLKRLEDVRRATALGEDRHELIRVA